MNLHRVADGKYLHWPKVIEDKTTLWLPPGGVLDLDDPVVRELAIGQEYKLEPDLGATAATEITHTGYLLYRRRLHESAARAPDGAAAADPTVASESIPKPDPRPKKEEKKHGALPSPVSQGDPR